MLRRAHHHHSPISFVTISAELKSSLNNLRSKGFTLLIRKHKTKGFSSSFRIKGEK
jgi:hypothetical protein